MKLVYCWIKKWINIENEGFNFGSQWIYNSSYTNNKLTITRKLNSKYIEGYFKNNNTGFENVTAIVGENGVGKSVILKYLADQLANYDYAYKHNHIFVFENEPGECKYFIGRGLHYESEFQQKENNIIVEPLDFILSEFKTNDEFLANYVTIYFSPIYDFTSSSEGNKLINVSSNRILEGDIGEKRESLNNSCFDWHRIREIERIINCLGNIDNSENRFFEKKINLPKEVFVSLDLSRFYPVELDAAKIPQNLIIFYNTANRLFTQEDTFVDS
jgi:hypothetical protein